MAITQAQLASHIGAMVVRGLQAATQEQVIDGITPALFFQWAADYRANGSGNAADRREAMSVFRKRYYEKATGRVFVSVSDPAAHHFLSHYLDQYTPNESANQVDGVVN